MVKGGRAWVEVDLGVVRENVRKVKKFTGREYMACVKADCYGMGAAVIAKNIEPLADRFGVATVEEGIELRDAGIKKPVMVLGAVLPEWVRDAVQNNLTLNVFSGPVLKELAKVTAKTGKKAVVHVKVDTGMARVGIRPEDAPAFIGKVAATKGIKIEGIFSHLATAEWRDKKYAREQIRRFNEVVETVARKVTVPLKHIANSAAVLNLPETYQEFDLVRLGLLLLGVYPDKYLYPRLRLDCALTGYARVLFVKEVPAGAAVSYGISYFTKKKKTRIATVGIGYADGLRRVLSNRFSLMIGSRKVPILGNVCMDQALVDVTGLRVREGDVVRVLGGKFDIENMAETAGTAPQEIMCGFGSRRMAKIYKGVRSER